MKSYGRLVRGMCLWTLVLLGAPVLCHANEGYFAEECGIAKTYVKKDYERAVLPAEKEILASVLHTLATVNELKLLWMKSDLNKTGKKIDHIHPLRKLVCVFTDESIRKDFLKMSKRSLVWRHYTERLTGVLELEADKGNLLDWQIEDFATTLQISPETARSYLNKRRWRPFLDWLVSAVPH